MYKEFMEKLFKNLDIEVKKILNGSNMTAEEGVVLVQVVLFFAHEVTELLKRREKENGAMPFIDGKVPPDVELYCKLSAQMAELMNVQATAVSQTVSEMYDVN